MKNKFIFFLTVCLFININYYDIKAEEFFFESQAIEITNNGNKIQAKDGVKVSTTNNIEITANESTYDKIRLILSLIGNIKVIDRENNIKIEGENIVYYKNREKIISKGNTIIHINNEYVINTSNIIYSKKENIIHSKDLATLEDNFENKFSAENFTFLVLDKIFKIKLKRGISDYFGNKLESGMVLTYSTSNKISDWFIEGKIFNNNVISPSTIALYKIINIINFHITASFFQQFKDHMCWVVVMKMN